MNNRKKILWLVSWYPNKYDAFDGDFIQRHAKATALYHDVHVLFVKQEFQQTEREESIHKETGLTEQIIYLPKQRGWKGKLKNFRRWKQVMKETTSYVIADELPAFVHVHVPWKAGLIALWAKKKFKIPYTVTEHWGIYNKVAEDSIYAKPLLLRSLLKKIYKEAILFVSVSNYLGKGVNSILVKKQFHVVPNAVNTELFQPSREKYNRFTFVHVSNMVPLKNVEGILQAFGKFLLQTGTDAQLVLIGNKDDHYEKLAQELNLLNSSVFFKGEVPYSEVAETMRRSHVFVLNSNVENSPCVIGEALCCGLPVIATAVGGIPELIDETSGMLVPPQNENALFQAMKEMHQNYQRYDWQAIASVAEAKFSYPSVGIAFSELYQQVETPTS